MKLKSLIFVLLFNISTFATTEREIIQTENLNWCELLEMEIVEPRAKVFANVIEEWMLTNHSKIKFYKQLANQNYSFFKERLIIKNSSNGYQIVGIEFQYILNKDSIFALSFCLYPEYIIIDKNDIVFKGKKHNKKLDVNIRKYKDLIDEIDRFKIYQYIIPKKSPLMIVPDP